MANVKSVLIYGRFSSAKQGEDGTDSKRRQTESAKEWAIKNGYSVRGVYFDEGVSSAIGKNLLKEFATLLKNLKPKEGILVEDLDRISRMHPWKVKGILFDLIMDGHNIIVWGKNRVYSEDTLGALETVLMGDIETALSNQEKEKKRLRQKEYWKGCVQAIESGKKVNCHKLPGWLEFKDDKFTVHEGKRELIERIFLMANIGIGSLLTVKTLIKENVPTIATQSNSTWNDAFIRSLLSNKAVLGTLTIKGTDYPNYFPRIITDTLFYSVQSRKKKGQTSGGRPTAESGTGNLFTHLLKCKHCGSSFVMSNSGDSHHYLVCSNGRLGKGCKFKSFSYKTMEEQIIEICLSPSFIKLFDNKSENDHQIETTLLGKQDDCDNQIKKIMSLIEDNDTPPKSLVKKLSALELEKEKLLVQIENFKVTTNTDNVNIARINEVQREIVVNYKKPEFRLRLKAFFQSIIEAITIDAKEKTYEVSFKNTDKVILWLGTNNVRVVNRTLEGIVKDIEDEDFLLNATPLELELRINNQEVLGTINIPEPKEEDFPYGSLIDKYGRTIERDDNGEIIKNKYRHIILVNDPTNPLEEKVKQSDNNPIKTDETPF